MLPLKDLNPRRGGTPVVTLAVIALNVAAFVFTLLLDDAGRQALVLRAGAIPIEIMTWRDVWPPNLIAPPLTILSSMFLHGGLLHLGGNMLFLWIFGDNVEDRMGRGRFAAFYLISGVVGALAQCFLQPVSAVPMIGASGAVAGVLGGYILVFPHARVLTLLPTLWIWPPIVTLPAWIFLGFWFLGQFFIGSGSGIAWMAHVGGFLAGLGLVRLFSRRERPRAAEAEYLPPARAARRSWRSRL